MYKLELNLKQHTPIIHFQHDQKGATLRASEVKPRLDRFILNHLGNGNYEEGKKMARDNGWLVSSNEHGALDYSLHISPIGDKTNYFFTSNPNSNRHDTGRSDLVTRELDATYLNGTQFFGNNENLKDNGGNYTVVKKESIKLGVLFDEINLKFVVKSNSLFEKLNKDNQKMIKACCSLNCFGTRSTKGFGCFHPTEISDSKLKEYMEYDHNVVGIFKKRNNNPWENKLKDIAEEYGLLKRGQSEVSNNGRIIKQYKKSKLWEYYCNSSSTKWEKRKIKEVLKRDYAVIFNNLKKNTAVHRLDNCQNIEHGEYLYIRALLGLAEQIEFVNSDFTRTKIKICDSSATNNSIERFKSPISYIISDDTVYLIIRKIDNNLSHIIDGNNTTLRTFQFKYENDTIANLAVPATIDLSDFINEKSGYTKLI